MLSKRARSMRASSMVMHVWCAGRVEEPTFLLRKRMRQRSLSRPAAQAFSRIVHSLAKVSLPSVLACHQIRQVPGLHLKAV